MSSKEEAAGSAIEAPKRASPQELIKPQIPNSKYTRRLVLKTLLERSDGGLEFVGERIVIGGWVKSSKEIRKEPPPQPEPEPQAQSGHKDLTCNEILQTRVPILRAFMKIFGMGGRSGKKEKEVDSGIEQRVQHPVESTVILQVSDGSCVPALQV